MSGSIPKCIFSQPAPDRLEFIFVLIITTQSQKTDRAATVSFISNAYGSFRVFAQLYYRNLYYRNFKVSQLC
jgi:hypothetical protein